MRRKKISRELNRFKSAVRSIILVTLMVCSVTQLSTLTTDRHEVPYSGTGINSLTTHFESHKQLILAMNFKNTFKTTEEFRVAWYVNQPEVQQPWISPSLETPWKKFKLAPGAEISLKQKVILTIETGEYQLTAFVHRRKHGNWIEIAVGSLGELLEIRSDGHFNLRPTGN